jgi:toxin-antitoxin system PIN domain toxin
MNLIGLDTNILLYARAPSSPWHEKARDYINSLASSSEVVISEQVLVELYLLLRNERVLSPPLSAEAAVRECHIFRTHPHWQLTELAEVMEEVWPLAARPEFPRRRIFDARLAMSLRRHGVTHFATANVKDFLDFGFAKVWNPLLPNS